MVLRIIQSPLDTSGMGIRCRLDNHHDLFLHLYGHPLAQSREQANADQFICSSMDTERILEPYLFLFLRRTFCPLHYYCAYAVSRVLFI